MYRFVVSMAPKCLWDVLPIMAAAQIQALLMVVMAIIAIIVACLGYNNHLGTLPIEIFLSVCEIVGSVLVFVACWKYQASFLIPILVFCVLSSILDVIEFVTYIIWAFLENSENRKEVDTIIATFDAVSFVLLIWFLINFKSCYEYLRALESSPQKFVREEEESQEYVCHM
ncbi:hypothetical protein PRIPAC_87510 [Pristionchus pacificus]|nr:hypothetical protein PRIPAC_87510 [Pristionchus pacificus]